MVPGSWSHGCCMPRYNCTRSWRHSHGLGCIFLADFWIFSTFTNLPQSNSVHRVGRSLPTFIYALGHRQGNGEFEQDHASSQKSWLATYWFDQLFFHFSVMIWPDINPIAHFLNVLEKGVKAHHTLTGLCTALANVWEAMSVERFWKLCECMPRRMTGVIKAKGDSIGY